MPPAYTYFADLMGEVEVPAAGILTRTLYEDPQVKLVVFGFDAGQELSEHTASVPAVLHFLRGEARLTLGKDSMETHAGAWVRLPAGLPHSVRATTALVMLLLLLKSASGEGGAAGR
ncbi:MAG: cupin domain-containing protein [Terriglobia bacterium]